MIAVIDYEVGNLMSVTNALKYIGTPAIITRDKREIERADGVILPGVGAFADAFLQLKEYDLVDFLKEQTQKKPLLGICLGMQLLFEKGYEVKESAGLGLISGDIIRIKTSLKLPQIGWNKLNVLNPNPLTKGVEREYVYFVHSFRADTADENINAYTEYGERIPAIVSRGNVYGCQFHPEKSGDVGLLILKNFISLI